MGYIRGNWLYYQGDMDDGPNKLYRMSLDGQVRDFIYYVLKNEEYHYDGNVDGIIFAAKINALLDNSVLSYIATVQQHTMISTLATVIWIFSQSLIKQ